MDLDAATHGAVSSRPHMPPRKDYLLAWNPVTRKAAFSVPGSGGGVLTTAGNLIFQGRPREGVLGTFVAFRATDGKQLWSWNAPDAMAGGPVTYLVKGEQYVAVISGTLFYSGTATPRIRHNGRMLAFKLNGSGAFPPDPPPAQPPNPPCAGCQLPPGCPAARRSTTSAAACAMGSMRSPAISCRTCAARRS